MIMNISFLNVNTDFYNGHPPVSISTGYFLLVLSLDILTTPGIGRPLFSPDVIILFGNCTKVDRPFQILSKENFFESPSWAIKDRSCQYINSTWNKIHKICKSEEKQTILDYYFHCINYLTKSFAEITFQKFETELMHTSKVFAAIA